METRWTIKAHLDADIHRWSVETEPADWDALQQSIRKAFGPSLDDTVLSIRYKDEDGDMITMACPDDLTEAVAHLRDNQPRLLRIEVSQPKRKPPPPTYRPPPPPDPPAAAAEVTVPQARFVSHVTIEDGSQLALEQQFTKTWRLRNTGPCVWPAHSRLIHVGGSLFSGPTEVSE